MGEEKIKAKKAKIEEGSKFSFNDKNIVEVYDKSRYHSDMGIELVQYYLAKAFSVKFDKGIKILDIGAGTGIFTIALQNAGFDVHAIDISEEMAKYAKKRGVKNYLVKDARSLPYGSKEFDITLSSLFLRHLNEESWFKVMEEIIRTTKKYFVTITRTFQPQYIVVYAPIIQTIINKYPFLINENHVLLHLIKFFDRVSLEFSKNFDKPVYKSEESLLDDIPPVKVDIFNIPIYLDEDYFDTHRILNFKQNQISDELDKQIYENVKKMVDIVSNLNDSPLNKLNQFVSTLNFTIVYYDISDIEEFVNELKSSK